MSIRVWISFHLVRLAHRINPNLLGAILWAADNAPFEAEVLKSAFSETGIRHGKGTTA